MQADKKKNDILIIAQPNAIYLIIVVPTTCTRFVWLAKDVVK